MNWIVVDLDGTLFDHAHRLDLAKSGLWSDYHACLADDRLNMDVAWLLKKLPRSIQIIFCTGRVEQYRSLTIDKIRSSSECPVPDELLMRPEMDYTSDHELKPRLLEEFFGGKSRVLEEVRFVMDDRDKVVEAWRNYGLPCWQVRAGGY